MDPRLIRPAAPAAQRVREVTTVVYVLSLPWPSTDEMSIQIQIWVTGTGISDRQLPVTQACSRNIVLRRGGGDAGGSGSAPFFLCLLFSLLLDFVHSGDTAASNLFFDTPGFKGDHHGEAQD